MGFFETLEKIREKPERTRNNLAVLMAVVLTAGIIILWLSLGALPEGKIGGEIKQKVGEPIQLIKDTFKKNG